MILEPLTEPLSPISDVHHARRTPPAKQRRGKGGCHWRPDMQQRACRRPAVSVYHCLSAYAYLKAHFTGKSNILRTSQGLRMAWLGGSGDGNSGAAAMQDDEERKSTSHLTNDDIADFLAKSIPSGQTSTFAAEPSAEDQHVDILLTHDWPAGITQHCTTALPATDASSWGVLPLRDVVGKLRPRYHFASGGGTLPVFWERQPYGWGGEDVRVTRFVSLGAFGGPEPEAGQKKERVSGFPSALSSAF